MRDENRHRRNDMTLVSDDGERFEVFIRQSLVFAENFSVGLTYLSKEGRQITLVRFNGQHNQTSDPLISATPHFSFHIHKATAENLNNGRLEKHPATTTVLYVSFNEALAVFFDKVSVEGVKKYFPEISPMPLFEFSRRAT